MCLSNAQVLNWTLSTSSTVFVYILAHLRYLVALATSRLCSHLLDITIFLGEKRWCEVHDQYNLPQRHWGLVWLCIQKHFKPSQSLTLLHLYIEWPQLSIKMFYSIFRTETKQKMNSSTDVSLRKRTTFKDKKTFFGEWFDVYWDFP